MAETSWRIEKSGPDLTLHLTGAVPELQVGADGGYELTLRSGGDSIHVALTATAMQVLGLQCAALLPDLMPAYAELGTQEAFRLPARVLLDFDDRSLQVLLREVQSTTVIDFLWYMKDAGLMRRVMDNLSERAAHMLMDDVENRWHGCNPDNLLTGHVAVGRAAVQTIMEIARRLADGGQIVVFDRGAP